MGLETGVAFATESEEHSFKSIEVTNTAYVANVLRNGNDFARKFTTDDWFKLNITGFAADSTATGTVEVYLADFRAGASTILGDWKKVDLSAIGRAHRLLFTLESSDASSWGMNTPAYFCFDNLTFVKD
jgi:hypothetical protein